MAFHVFSIDPIIQLGRVQVSVTINLFPRLESKILYGLETSRRMPVEYRKERCKLYSVLAHTIFKCSNRGRSETHPDLDLYV